MKIVVARDDNGYFMAKPINDRKGVLNLLHEVHGGSYFSDITKDYNIKLKLNLDDYAKEEWESILYTFVHRGTLEIIKINFVF